MNHEDLHINAPLIKQTDERALALLMTMGNFILESSYPNVSIL